MKHKRTPRVTPEMAAVVKALLAQTDMTQAQIAASVGAINQGRVSEIKNGKRYPEVPPCSITEARKIIRK